MIMVELFRKERYRRVSALEGAQYGDVAAGIIAFLRNSFRLCVVRKLFFIRLSD